VPARRESRRRRLKARRATWPRWARVLTTKPVAIPVATITILALAFFTYGAITRLGPTKFSRGGPVFDEVASPTNTPTGTGPTGGGPAPKGIGSSRVPKPPRASRKAKSGDGGAGGTGGPTGGAASSLPTPVTGVYQVRMNGSESVHFGPVSICNRSLPSSGSFAVNRAQGETPTSYVFDFPISDDHTERHIYRYEGDQMFLDFEGARVTCAGVSQTSEVSFSPPELRVAAGLKVGAEWSGRSGDADRTEAYRASVVRTESVTVAGVAVASFVIETRIDLSGSESGHRFQRWWYAPSLGLPVKWYEEISAARSGATYQERATFTVVSLP
jgi:hypothetical protein